MANLLFLEQIKKMKATSEKNSVAAEIPRSKDLVPVTFLSVLRVIQVTFNVSPIFP